MLSEPTSPCLGIVAEVLTRVLSKLPKCLFLTEVQALLFGSDLRFEVQEEAFKKSNPAHGDSRPAVPTEYEARTSRPQIAND